MHENEMCGMGGATGPAFEWRTLSVGEIGKQLVSPKLRGPNSNTKLLKKHKPDHGRSGHSLVKEFNQGTAGATGPTFAWCTLSLDEIDKQSVFPKLRGANLKKERTE